MKIPWLTTVLGAVSDGRIAALLEKQVVHITHERDEALLGLKQAETKIKKLEAQVKELTPKSGVAPEAAKVLYQFAERGRELTADQIADLMGIIVGKVIHHFGSLRALGFSQISRARSNDSEPPYRITAKGSLFLVEKGML